MSADFARQLERELAEVTKERDAFKAINDRKWYDSETYRVQLAAVTKERDELKEDNDYRRTEMGNVWEMVQKISPWQESNDMNWSDEISCGLNGIAEQLAAALARAEKAEEALRDTVTELARMTEHATRWCGDGPIESYKAYAALNAARAALTPTKEPAP